MPYKPYRQLSLIWKSRLVSHDRPSQSNKSYQVAKLYPTNLFSCQQPYSSYSITKLPACLSAYVLAKLSAWWFTSNLIALLTVSLLNCRTRPINHHSVYHTHKAVNGWALASSCSWFCFSFAFSFTLKAWERHNSKTQGSALLLLCSSGLWILWQAWEALTSFNLSYVA